MPGFWRLGSEVFHTSNTVRLRLAAGLDEGTQRGQIAHRQQRPIRVVNDETRGTPCIQDRNDTARCRAEQIGQVLATKWSLATALSLLAWYIFAPQCASTLAVIRRETGSWKWMAITFGYMLALAYAASLVTYNIAVALGAG